MEYAGIMIVFVVFLLFAAVLKILFDKRCPYCRMVIPRGGRLCPYCRSEL